MKINSKTLIEKYYNFILSTKFKRIKFNNNN